MYVTIYPLISTCTGLPRQWIFCTPQLNPCWLSGILYSCFDSHGTFPREQLFGSLYCLLKLLKNENVTHPVRFTTACSVRLTNWISNRRCCRMQISTFARYFMTIEQWGFFTVSLLIRRWASSETRNTRRSCRESDISAVDTKFVDIRVGLFRIGFEHPTFCFHNMQADW